MSSADSLLLSSTKLNKEEFKPRLLFAIGLFSQSSIFYGYLVISLFVKSSFNLLKSHLTFWHLMGLPLVFASPFLLMQTRLSNSIEARLAGSNLIEYISRSHFSMSFSPYASMSSIFL